ncbi:MAG: winged helix-turn-helix domain-containing protein, partial [Acidobacteriota bacterium]
MSFEKSPSFVLDLSESDLNGEERHFYDFRSFRLNVAERQLLRRNSPIPLTPKAFDVLALLIQRRGHLVGRDELLESVWADSFVEEQNITRVIHTLRRALGENDSGDKFIETVAKKGYRFVADVTEVHEPEGSKQENVNGKAAFSGNKHHPEPGSLDLVNVADLVPAVSSETLLAPAPEPKHRTRVVLFTVGFLTAVSLIVLLSFNFRSNPAKSPNKVTSIAVLPIRPVNAAQRDEVYEMGIAESLIHALGPMKGLIVRPLSATRQYSDIAQDPLAAGREQKVDYVLASNYQIAGGRIRITSQLFNVATGQIDETYKSERDTADLFTMQDAIAGEIGNKLRTLFGITVTGRQAKRGTTNEEAYRLYLQGRNLTMKRSQADAKKAVEYLEQAIRLDPNFAPAYAQMARALPYSEPGKVKEFINRALELDPYLAEAYVARAELTFFDDWDFQSVEKDLATAIELDPNNDTAHWWWALLLSNRGRFDEALREIDVAQAIRGSYIVTDSEVESPNIHVLIDSSGRDNIPKLPPNKSSAKTDVVIKGLRSSGGSFHGEDRRQRIDATLPLWTLAVDGDAASHHIQFQTGQAGRLGFEDRGLPLKEVSLDAVLRDAALDIKAVKV